MGVSKSKNQKPIDLQTMEARVDRIKISGLQRTHEDYIRRAVQNVFNAKTFQQLLLEAAVAKNNITELGIFKNLHIAIDVSRSEVATPNGYEIQFTGVEHSKITGSVGTEIGHNEGALIAELSAPNIFGRGERVGLHGSYSNSKTTDLNLKFSKPFYHTGWGDFKPETSFSLFKNATQYPWSKYKTHDFGMLWDFSFLMPTFVSHSLQYEFAVRDIEAMEKQVPFYVRENFGPRLASVFRHICSFDQRDSTSLPTQGLYIKMTNEVAGAGGDISYMKNNTHGEINVPLFAGISLQFCGRVGILQSDGSTSVPISNLFVLGGPLNIRGFQTGGASTQREGTATGAQTYWASGVHLWSPLPFHRHFGMFSDNLRLHFFGVLGNVDNWSLDNHRSSVGAGLAFRIGDRARIELNYCKPISRQANDFVNKEGFQFGIGYEFL